MRDTTIHSVNERMNRNKRIERLILQIADGNKSALGELYDLIKTDVFSFAFVKTKNKQIAEDIMQDTFVQVYKNACLYKNQGKPMAWIITVEYNLIRRHFQLEKRTVNLDESFENTPSNENLEKRVTDNAFLQQMFDILSEEERSIVTLHVVSGLKHKEIAKIYEKPLATVLSKYNRAIKKLQIWAKEV